MWELGSAYHMGELGLKKDPLQAWQYYSLSAKAGFLPAMAECAVCCSHGVGVNSDVSKANEWACRALVSNDDYAVGVCYYYGVGVSTEREQARIRFERVSDFPEAQHFLGQLYENGGEMGKSLFWFRKAASNGLKYAQRAAREIRPEKGLVGSTTIIDVQKHTCDNCGNAMAKRLKCTACETVTYCEQKCQRAHWKIHKPVCFAKRFFKDDENGPCSLSLLGLSNLYTLSELTSLQQCRVFLQNLPRKSVHVIDDISALKRFSSFSPNYVKTGYIGCVTKGSLFTYGVATCVVLLICGTNSENKPQIFLQHLSGHNFRGNPQENVSRDLKKILGKGFIFSYGCIIPGGMLDEQLICSSQVDNVDSDPTMQLLIWEQLCHFDWREKLELWTDFDETYKIELGVPNKINVYADHALKLQSKKK
jgi:hypothetical protein